MSVYNNGIKTFQLDPIYHQSKVRTEFRFPLGSAVYTSNVRLMNLGVVLDSNNSQNCRLNSLGGVPTILKNIYLYDGSQVLDQVLNFPTYWAFKKYNTTNATAFNVDRKTSHNGLGFVFNNPTNDPQEYPQIIEMYKGVEGTPTNNTDTTQLNWLVLSDLFPLLNNLPYLDMNLFPNLRVVLEYTTNDVLVLPEDTNDGIPGNTIASTVQPLMCIDELVDPMLVQKLRSEYKGTQWSCLESEVVQLPAGVPTKTFKLNGFNNKLVSSMFLQKSSKNTNITKSYLYKSLGSEAMVGEQINVLLNGSQLVPMNGLDRPSLRLSLLTHLFGSFNTIIGANQTAFYAISQYVDEVNERTGHLDYAGWAVGDRVKDLQVQYTRTFRSGEDGAYTLNLDMNFFGYVSKIILLTKSGYTVQYI